MRDSINTTPYTRERSASECTRRLLTASTTALHCISIGHQGRSSSPSTRHTQQPRRRSQSNNARQYSEMHVVSLAAAATTYFHHHTAPPVAKWYTINTHPKITDIRHNTWQRLEQRASRLVVKSEVIVNQCVVSCVVLTVVLAELVFADFRISCECARITC